MKCKQTRPHRTREQRRTGRQRTLSKAICLAASLVLASLVPVSALLIQSSPADAQTTAPSAAPAKPTKSAKPKPAPKAANAPAAETAAKDPAVAQRSFESGRTAYQAGKFESAIQSMNAAIQVGGLDQKVLANALLVRGASYQKSGKPGQAISDLTSAMWLKDGLSASERAEAAQFRSQAYTDAGVSEQAAVPGQSGGASSAGTDTGVRNLETASTRTSAAPTAPIASLNAVPTEGTSTPQTGLSGASVGKFFSDIFSPLQSTAPPSSPPPAALAAPAASSNSPEVLPWAVATAPATTASLPTTSSSPAVTAKSAANKSAANKPAAEKPAADKPTSKPAPVKAAAAKPAAAQAAVAPTAAGQGTYRIQVAAVKSRDEASQVIAKLQDSGGVLAASPSAVDETTFGSMGTFYRVRLGPFASAAATKAPCESLKAKGFDCLVTTN